MNTAKRVLIERHLAEAEKDIAARHQLRVRRVVPSEVDCSIQSLRRKLLAAYAAYKASVRETSRLLSAGPVEEAVLERQYEAMAMLVQARAAFAAAVSMRLGSLN